LLLFDCPFVHKFRSAMFAIKSVLNSIQFKLFNFWF